MLYIIYTEGLHYCGYGEHVVVEAESSDDAVIKASSYIEEYFYEQDYDQFVEEHGQEAADDETFSNVISVEVFDQQHELWPYQADFTKI